MFSFQVIVVVFLTEHLKIPTKLNLYIKTFFFLKSYQPLKTRGAKRLKICNNNMIMENNKKKNYSVEKILLVPQKAESAENEKRHVFNINLYIYFFFLFYYTYFFFQK